jgi:hemerythrin superfamily protein
MILDSITGRRLRASRRPALSRAGWPIAAIAVSAAVLLWNAQRRSPGRSPVRALLDAVGSGASDDARAEARRQAEEMAAPDDWLSMVLEHHRDIEDAFAAVAAAKGRSSPKAMNRLARILMGHSIAEEAVLYPALAEAGHKSRSTLAYGEQAMTKTEMAKLEKLDPNSAAFADKLETIRLAVVHHMHEEESTWFPLLRKQLPDDEQELLTTRFAEEFGRYAS